MGLEQDAKTAVGKFPIHTYTIPEAARELDTDPKEISIRQLTMQEEKQALARAANNQTSFTYEGAMASVVAADGKEITWTDDGKETFFSSMSNQVRDLVIRAFARIALPEVKTANDFFGSEKKKIA